MESEASIESARKEANLEKKKLIWKTACCKKSKKLILTYNITFFVYFCASFCIFYLSNV